LGEIAIIDHSTTTAEAKSSSGGKYKKGGDILYRYGNPANYNRGSKSDQQLFFQHNPNWIQYGPDKGKIIIFNNLLSSKNYSRVEIIDPPIKSDGSYEIKDGEPYEPIKPEKTFGTKPEHEKIISQYTSGAKVLPNGNIAITEGQNNRLFEINPEGIKVWEYYVPKSSYIFRSERYPIDYPAFVGKNINAVGSLENPVSNYSCVLYPLAVEESKILDSPKINKIDGNKIYLNLDKGKYFIYNLQGILIEKGDIENGIIDMKYQQKNAMYFIYLHDKNKSHTLKFLY
jgi:hypothetical protein